MHDAAVGGVDPAYDLKPVPPLRSPEQVVYHKHITLDPTWVAPTITATLAQTLAFRPSPSPSPSPALTQTLHCAKPRGEGGRPSVHSAGAQALRDEQPEASACIGRRQAGGWLGWLERELEERDLRHQGECLGPILGPV